MIRSNIVVVLVMAGTQFALASSLPFHTPFLESIDESRRVSGDTLLGLAYVDAGIDNPLQSIHARLLGYTGDLELRISSIDGRYFTQLEYTRTTLGDNWIELDLPAKTLEWINVQANRSDTVAFLLSNAARDRHFEVAWNVPAVGSVLQAYINSERTQGFIKDTAARRRIACIKPPPITKTIIFDQVCPLNVGLRGREIEIERRDGSRVLSAIPLDLELMSGADDDQL